MTIKQSFPYDLKLLLKLKALKVHFEANSESMWWVEYRGLTMALEDALGRTTKEDEVLPPAEVEAQIYLGDTEILPTEKKEKSIIFDGGNGVIITGIYEDIIETEGDEGITYKLDSIFPIEIEKIPPGAKIGDWITATGEGRIMLPRKSNW